jgi:hypothetical protein
MRLEAGLGCWMGQESSGRQIRWVLRPGPSCACSPWQRTGPLLCCVHSRTAVFVVAAVAAGAAAFASAAFAKAAGPVLATHLVPLYTPASSLSTAR